MLNKEIELKFGFDGDAKNLYRVFSNIGKVSGQTTLHLDNTYFDTPNKDFFSFKAGLRIRIADNFSEQTLKVKGENIGGLHKRSEFNVPVDKNSRLPNLRLFPKEAFPEEFDLDLLQTQLKPVCKINFERHLFNLEVLDSTFEVAYDHGEIKVENNSYPLNELEIELIESTVKNEELLNLFSILCSHLASNDIPLLIEPFSKMHRATLLQERGKNVLDISALDKSDDLITHVSKLVALFEQMYGLFLISYEPTLFGFIVKLLDELLTALKLLKRRNFFAFLPMQREPVEYKEDLQVIIRLLKNFYSDCYSLNRKLQRARLKGNFRRCQSIVADLREAEKRSKMFLIPLKLRHLLSVLNK